MGKKYVVLTKSGYLQDNLSCGVSDTATKLDFDKAVKAADLIGGEVRAIELSVPWRGVDCFLTDWETVAVIGFPSPDGALIVSHYGT